MSELKRDFKGVWIPKEVWFNKEITPLEKMFLAEIDSLDSSEQMGCFAANSHFAEMFDISEGRAANIISSLRVRGFVVTVFFDGRQRGIRLSPKVKAGLTENVKAGLSESVKSGSRKTLKQVHGKRDTIIGTNLDTNLDREAQAPNSHSQPEAEPSQFGEKEKQPIPFPKSPSQIPLDARPGAKTPSELVAAMRKFYTDYPIEWSDGVLQLAKGSQYSEQKRQDIVTDWAAHQITQNQGSNTFAQLNASLQKWFRNQKDFDRQYGKPAEAAAPRNDNSKPLPAYVE